MSKNLKERILAGVADDLAEIEKELKANITPYLEKVSQVAGHLLFNGGKRMRPLFMVLSAKLCNYQGQYDKKFSVIFEYVHTASLLHDDLVDAATMRRGKPVANAIWGNTSAVLVGDYLLARASGIAVKANKLEILNILSTVTEHMVQGELHQLSRKGAVDLSEEEYRQIIQNKTAALIQGACRSGAIIADAPKEQEQAMADYGLNVGLAFQMADDLLDYISDSVELGKTIGADLREGKLTLPLIHTLAKADAGDAATIQKIVADEQFSDEDWQALKGLLDKYGGIEYTEKCATAHIQKAKAALDVFPDAGTKELLSLLADYTISRET
jgi:octaprenyl-diphosphate synthase